MRKPAILASLLLALSLVGCATPPEVGTALSEPDPALIDARLSGRWYFLGPAEYARGDLSILEITPRTDGGGFDVVGLSIWIGGTQLVQWLKATAYASELDGKIYYNVKRVPGVGDDYTAGNTESFLILKPVIASDASLFFLRSMNPELLEKMVEDGKVSGRKVEQLGKARHGVEYLVYDFSRADLVRLVRETPQGELLPIIIGPFYRMSPDLAATAAESGPGPADARAKFGVWRVVCVDTESPNGRHACRVESEGGDVVIWFTTNDAVGVRFLLGSGRCNLSGMLAQIDEAPAQELMPAALQMESARNPKVLLPIGDLVERMHFGHVLHLDYGRCASGGDTKHADVPLDGFAAAYAMAKNLVYQMPR